MAPTNCLQALLTSERAGEWEASVGAELAKMPHFRRAEVLKETMSTRNGNRLIKMRGSSDRPGSLSPKLRPKYQLAEGVVRRMVKENAVDVRLFETWVQLDMLSMYALRS